MNKEYHKIETLFERDMEGTKKLIEGKFRNPLVEYIKDCEWIFTEKVDGTNIRIHWDGHNVYFAGRTDNAQLPSPLVQELNKLFLGMQNEELFEQKFGERNVIFYGEGYGGKIQLGSAYSKEQKFILFDVMVGGIFLERENVEEIAKSFNLEIVPVLIKGTVQEAVDYVKTKPNSTISIEEKESEGLVGTPLIRMNDAIGNRVIIKVKVCDFE